MTLSLYGASDELVDRLVNLEMLDVDGDRVRPHDWHEVNLSSDAIRDRRSESARIANHGRWHTGPFDTCPRCNPPKEQTPRSSDTDSDRTPTGSDLSPEVKGEGESEGMQQQATDPADTPTRRNLRLAAAAEIIGERAALRPGVENPVGCARAVAKAVIADRFQDAYAALAANPLMTAEELAEFLEPTPQPTAKPEPVNTSAFLRPVSEVLDRTRVSDEEKAAGLELLRQLRANPAEGAAVAVANGGAL